MKIFSELRIKLMKFQFTLKLKNQLLIYLILVAFLPTFSIGIYSDYIMKNMIKNDAIENNYIVVSHMMESIDRRIEDVNKFTDWICRDTSLVTLLKRSPKEVESYDITKKEAIKKIQEQFEYNPVASNILSLFVIGDNGLDIRNGIEASLIEHELFNDKEWFVKGKQANGRAFWGNITENYTKITLNNYVTPQMRTINDSNTGKSIGSLVILFDEYFFSNIYKEFSTNNGEQIYLTDIQGNVFSTNQPAHSENSMRNDQIFGTMVKNGVLKDERKNHFEVYLGNQLNLVTYTKSSKTGWILIQIVPMTQAQTQSNMMKNKIIMWFIVVIISSVLLALMLSVYFTKPLVILNNQVHQIARGNFKQTISLKGNNEISELAESINHMKTDLEVLLHDRIDKEREKRIIEIKMLQSQITPHFLYNTLNSIKVMASLQGAQGIEKMVGCLGKLLKASLSEVNEKITLEEEINILNDYMHIQRIRYKGKVQFQLNISDENLLKCSMIKFTLQPLIENAIFHGIEPKDEMGEIILSVYEQNHHLILEIWDDGIGMSEQVIQTIKEKQIGKKDSSRQGMGLNNIDQRIKLIYGKQYGIHFESHVGEYTKVTLILPIEVDNTNLHHTNKMLV